MIMRFLSFYDDGCVETCALGLRSYGKVQSQLPFRHHHGHCGCTLPNAYPAWRGDRGYKGLDNRSSNGMPDEDGW